MALSAVGLLAQDITSGTIQGSVSDQQGAAVAGAAVEARNVETNFAKVFSTDDDGFLDWQALIGGVSDFWNHVLLYAPDYPIDPIERHRAVHERRPLTGGSLDRWLEILYETVDTGWSGPNAERVKKRGTGVAWAMAQRLLGKGVWRPPVHR